MSSKPTEESADSKTESSQTMACNTDIALRAIKAAEEATRVADQASKRLESPWKGWSFLYKLMFVIGVSLLLVLSCLIPIILLQQTSQNATQDDHIAGLLTTTSKDDNIIISNQEKILKNQATQIANLQKVVDSQVLLSANQAAVCAVLPTCKFSTTQPTPTLHR